MSALLASTCTLGPIQSKRFQSSKKYRTLVIEKIILTSYKDKRDTFLRDKKGNLLAYITAPRISPQVS